MMDFNKIHEALYEATLKATQKTGDEYKNISWFPRNRNTVVKQQKDN